MALTNGAQQETPVELWEGGEDSADWKAMHAIAAFTSEPESTGRLCLAHKPLTRDAKAIMDLLPAKHEYEPAAGRTVPDAGTSLAGRGAVSLANELDEEGEWPRPGPVATPARTAVIPTQEEHEP